MELIHPMSDIERSIPFLPCEVVDIEIRQAVRRLMLDFPLDYWNHCEEDKRFPEEFFKAFTAAGWLGMIIPESYGGGGGSLRQQAAVLQEVAGAGGALDACTSVHAPVLWLPTLLKFGSPEQKREYLPRVPSGELYVTFGVTEPSAGTDTTRIATRAEATSSGWRISGQKTWNSGALRGNKIMLLARTSPRSESSRGHGMSLFLVDLDDPRVHISPISKFTRNAVASCEVFFDNVEVPSDRLIGELDRGFYHLLASLNGERLLLASEAIGIGRWAVQVSSQYARDRVVFDRPIGMNQAIQHPIASAYTQLMAASELVQTAIRSYEDDQTSPRIGGLVNSAKVVSTNAAFAAANAAMQTFGGYSFAREYGIARVWSEARLQQIAPISNELALSQIAEQLLKLPRSY
jgi:acyl-CoA dehydrogenase